MRFAPTEGFDMRFGLYFSVKDQEESMMKNESFTCNLVTSFFATGVTVLLLCFADPALSAPQVGGAIAIPGGQVAATPISIPRPIRLEKMTQLSGINQSNQGAAMSRILAPSGGQETIAACELVAIRGREITLRLHYRINPARTQPIYAGAWLYDASRKSIDAGYKPVAIGALPDGSVDVVLVLPEHDFRSAHVMTFLMESGQPVFVNGRFKMAYSWNGKTLSAMGEELKIAGTAPAASQPLSDTAFCKEYADTAVTQYNDAIANDLPGIVAPVWSGDAQGHYDWCLGVPRENARQGTALRQGHLDRYKVISQKDATQHKAIDNTNQKALQPMGKAMVIKPLATKSFDPGRGP